MLRACGGFTLLFALSATFALGQTPQPFPRPGAAQPQSPRPAAPAPTTTPAPAPAAASAPVAADGNAPSAETLVFPVYPSARFLASYDAGRGQRYYVFGSTAPYSELVAYYRTQLKDKGDQIYEQPATYMFQIGRFRDETMAFPPGVTIKDWTMGGSSGYPNPKLGAEPARFPSVIMIVPPPAGTPAR